MQENLRKYFKGSLLVSVGDQVTRGQRIATMGKTGAGGTEKYPLHLHFGLYDCSNEFIDPEPFFLPSVAGAGKSTMLQNNYF